MLPDLEKVRGIHPGAVLKRALKKRDITASDLARSIDEHKQTLSTILNGRRSVNPKLSIKLSKVFDARADYFMLMQASYDVQQQVAMIPKRMPNLKHFRKALFWDTQLDGIGKPINGQLYCGYSNGVIKKKYRSSLIFMESRLFPRLFNLSKRVIYLLLKRI
tara:strand:- start:117 stop:602 length:486 start_codon:yes stop_codon:yes gene_type:complete